MGQLVFKLLSLVNCLSKHGVCALLQSFAVIWGRRLLQRPSAVVILSYHFGQCVSLLPFGETFKGLNGQGYKLV